MKLQHSLTILLIVTSVTISFSQSTWEGNTSIYWDDATNWDPIGTPISSTDVIIPAASTVTYIPSRTNSPMTCRDLTIKPGGQLTVKGETLTIHGDLLIESPAGNGVAGSLIEEGNLINVLTGTVTVERTYSTNSSWQYISAPLGGQKSDLFTTAGAEFNSDFLSYNEAYNCVPDPTPDNQNDEELYEQWNTTDLVFAWSNHHNGDEGASKDLITGNGYAYYNDANITVSYTGSNNDIARGNIDVPLTFTKNDGNRDFFDGWNLIGNPYTSGYRLDNRAAGNVERTVYLWDGPNQNYKYFNYSGASGGNIPVDGSHSGIANGTTKYTEDGIAIYNSYEYIPPGQGFFVKAKEVYDTEGVLEEMKFNFKQTRRKHTSDEMFRAPQEEQESSLQFIKLKIEANGFSDETVIRFIEESTTGHDGNYDSYKLSVPNQEVPQIYSYSEETFAPWAINSLPGENQQQYTTPLTIRVPVTGVYTVVLSEFNLNLSNAVLEDTFEGLFIDLNTNSSYTFIQEGGSEKNRYKIHFRRTATEINQVKSVISIFPIPSKGKFAINIAESIKIESIVIHDISGKNVFSQRNNDNNYGNIDLSDKKDGVYFITIKTKNEVFTEKVIIQH